MVTNFPNALDCIPKFMEQYKSQNAAIEKDLPTLREIVGGTWKKEEELKGLKSEVATLERKIQLTLNSSNSEIEQERPNGIKQGSERHELQTGDAKKDINDTTRISSLAVRSRLSDVCCQSGKGMKL